MTKTQPCTFVSCSPARIGHWQVHKLSQDHIHAYRINGVVDVHFSGRRQLAHHTHPTRHPVNQCTPLQPQHTTPQAHLGVPRASSVACVSLGANGNASPKSATVAVSGGVPGGAAHMRTLGRAPVFAALLLVSMTLPALRSPCTMPSLCRCSMAAATSCARASTVEGARKPPGLASRPQSRASRNEPCRVQHERARSW